jgi:hypothetical protein
LQHDLTAAPVEIEEASVADRRDTVGPVVRVESEPWVEQVARVVADARVEDQFAPWYQRRADVRNVGRRQ